MIMFLASGICSGQGNYFMWHAGSVEPLLPFTVLTNSIASITHNSFTVNSEIINCDGQTVTSRGIVFSTTPAPTTSNMVIASGSGCGTYTIPVSAASGYTIYPSTLYHVRAYTVRTGGIITYGNELDFTTLCASPVIITAATQTGITESSFTLYGKIESLGCEYTNVDFYMALSQSPDMSNRVTQTISGYTIGQDKDASFTSPMTGTPWQIASGTTYYYQVGIWVFPAVEGQNFFYGNPRTVTTTTPPPVVDGGYFYNRYSAYDARNIAPAGWHVPTTAEWMTLATYAGGQTVAGGKLKEVGTTYWTAPNTCGTNNYGFNARGTGRRVASGLFDISGTKGTTSWHSYDAGYVTFGTSYFTCVLSKTTGDSSYAKDGNSIRLIKDNSTNTGSMTGNDGRTYSTVTIGTQVWMAENLKETRYRNQDLIPEVQGNTAWSALTTGARCYYVAP